MQRRVPTGRLLALSAAAALALAADAPAKSTPTAPQQSSFGRMFPKLDPFPILPAQVLAR